MTQIIFSPPRFGKTKLSAEFEQAFKEAEPILIRERNYWMGKIIPVFQVKYNPEAYTTSDGKKHPADVVTKEIYITIFDTIVVTGIWLEPGDRKVGLGLYAKDDHENIYENNTGDYPVGLQEPRALWHNRETGNWLYNPTAHPYNKLCIPILKLDGSLMK